MVPVELRPVRFDPCLGSRIADSSPCSSSLAALGAAGCTNPNSGQLLLADVPDPQADATDIAIYAVDPGEDADADTVLTGKALSPLDITTTAERRARSWVNSLGRVWDGSVLLAYGDGESNIVTLGHTRARTRPSSPARPRRARRCCVAAPTCRPPRAAMLATSADAVDQVGTGNCAISLDERWVASWPTDGTGPDHPRPPPRLHRDRSTTCRSATPACSARTPGCWPSPRSPTASRAS